MQPCIKQNSLRIQCLLTRKWNCKYQSTRNEIKIPNIHKSTPFPSFTNQGYSKLNLKFWVQISGEKN